MVTVLGAAAGGLAALGVAHHVTGTDAGAMAVWSLASLWHVVSTVVFPVILVAVSIAFTFPSTPKVRPREVVPMRDEMSVLSYAPADRPGSSAGDDERERRERPPARAVDRFYRVTFGDERGFRLWTERVVEFTAILQDVFPAIQDMRPVIFVQLRPSDSAPLQAYVSAGARGLAAHISGGAKVDPTPVTMSELPPGLTMLFGEGVDADEYEHRHA